MDKLIKQISIPDAIATFVTGLALLITSLPPNFTGATKAEIVVFVLACVLAIIAIFFIVAIIKRKSPDDIPSYKEATERADEIWGLWRTGTEQLKLIKKSKYTKRYKKILLMDINNKNTFSKMMTSSGMNESIKRKSTRDIKRLTQLAVNSGIEVKWYGTIQTSSFTLYNPIDMRAFTIVSDWGGITNRKHRKLTMFRIRESGESDGYQMRRITFDSVWTAASTRVPNQNEYM